MSEQETQQTQPSQGETESYTSGGVTYVGAVRARYGRLQEVIEEFHRQAAWLSGYLFVVSEHFSIGGDGLITERAVISYLDEVPKVAAEAEAALLEVEKLAAELRRSLADAARERRGREGEGLPEGYNPEVRERLRQHEAQVRKGRRARPGTQD